MTDDPFTENDQNSEQEPKVSPKDKIKNLTQPGEPKKPEGWDPQTAKKENSGKSGWFGEGELAAPFYQSQKENGLIDENTVENEKTQTYQPVEKDNEKTLPPPGGQTELQSVYRPPETDIYATRVLPVGSITEDDRAPGGRKNAPGNKKNYASTQTTYPGKPSNPKTGSGKGGIPRNPLGIRPSAGCLVRGSVIGLFVLAVFFVILASVTVYQYFSLTHSSNFPDVSTLAQHASQFETTKIYDRNGNLLYEMVDPNAGRRTYVSLKKISPYLIAATVATEDKDYFNHPGFDPLAITRALWQNYTTGEVVSGASTITQQLARSFLLSSTERNEKTVQRKAKEIVLAAEMTRLYSKEEILELYLNENNYGNTAYGIEAAAETYFNTSADKLTLGQSAFLAGLPQAPSIYDINTNRDGTLTRQKQVLLLMYQDSQEKNCIYARADVNKVCVSAENVLKGIDEIAAYHFVMPQNNMAHPHWVNYIRSVLEQEFGNQTIYMSGFSVYTTLDSTLQQKAEEIVKNQVQKLTTLNVNGGALVAIKPDNGEILAMVGSPDFNNEKAAGQINMAISPRQPGSSIKPLTYLAAFEKGWTPATLIWDIPSDFPPSGKADDTSPVYTPVNYDGKFHGPVLVRDAIANSYNIPAVKTLQFVGIYDDKNTQEKDGFINFAQRMGITTLTRKDYGLSLTLGGGDVSLLELSSAFGVIANSGVKVPPVSILKIVNYKGETVFENSQPAKQQVLRPEHAYLMDSILSDNQARTPMFGSNSVLNLPFTAAVKTGTTNDFRDNWTIGYTPDLVVGVWVGNPDYTPMKNTTGLTGAAPIWSEFMKYAVDQLDNGKPKPFTRPTGVIEKMICAVSGTEPADGCPSQKVEYFASDQPPLPKTNDFWQKMTVDTWTGKKASAACGDYTEERPVLNVKDRNAERWINDTQEGKEWAASIGFKDSFYFAPENDCSASDPRPTIVFENIQENQNINSSPLDIYALVNASANFGEYSLEFGKGDKPNDWQTLVGGIKQAMAAPGQVYSWNLDNLDPGLYTLRITIKNNDGFGSAQKTVHINLTMPTRTPTPIPTATNVPTAMPTATQTPIPAPTETNTAVSSPTESPTP